MPHAGSDEAELRRTAGAVGKAAGGTATAPVLLLVAAVLLLVTGVPLVVAGVGIGGRRVRLGCAARRAGWVLVVAGVTRWEVAGRARGGRAAVARVNVVASVDAECVGRGRGGGRDVAALVLGCGSALPQIAA